MAEMKTVTDALGRTLKIRELDPADMLDLIEAAGEVAGNPAWIRYAMSVASVAEFDGVPVPLPENKDQIKAFARRIGNEGYVAAVRAVWGIADPPAKGDDKVPGEAPADPVGDVAKNS